MRADRRRRCRRIAATANVDAAAAAAAASIAATINRRCGDGGSSRNRRRRRQRRRRVLRVGERRSERRRRLVDVWRFLHCVHKAIYEREAAREEATFAFTHAMFAANGTHRLWIAKKIKLRSFCHRLLHFIARRLWSLDCSK